MSRVRVEPAGIEFKVEPGTTVMAAAVALGYYWPTTCGGEGRCTTCAVEIIDGDQHISPMGNAEFESLTEARGRRVAGGGLRLACQITISDDITVRKPGVLPPDAA